MLRSMVGDDFAECFAERARVKPQMLMLIYDSEKCMLFCFHRMLGDELGEYIRRSEARVAQHMPMLVCGLEECGS